MNSNDLHHAQSTVGTAVALERALAFNDSANRGEKKAMNTDPTIRTTSRLKAMYLVHVRGLRVRAVYCMPLITLTTFMFYSRTWILVP